MLFGRMLTMHSFGPGDELEQKVSGLVQQQESILDSASQAADESRIFQEENCEILDDIACVRGVTQYTIWLRLIEQVKRSNWHG